MQQAALPRFSQHTQHCSPEWPQYLSTIEALAAGGELFCTTRHHPVSTALLCFRLTMSGALAAFAKQAAKACTSSAARSYAASAGDAGFKVGVLGAAGGIGQPLSLLMKVRPGLLQFRKEVQFTSVWFPAVGTD